MTCVLSQDALRPIYAQGVLIGNLIKSPQENGQLLGKEAEIEKHLFSAIGVVLTLSDKEELENNPFVGKYKTLKDLIKTIVSDWVSLSNILKLLEKIEEVFKKSIQSNIQKYGIMFDYATQINVELRSSNPLVPNMWAMISTLSVISRTHEEHLQAFEDRMGKLMTELGQVFTQPWKTIGQIHILHGLVSNAIKEHGTGCQLKKRKISELQLDVDSLHNKEIVASSAKRPQLTIQLPGSIASSSTKTIAFTLPQTPKPQISSKEFRFPRAQALSLPSPSTPATPVQQTCLSFGKLEMASPRTAIASSGPSQAFHKCASDTSLTRLEKASPGSTNPLPLHISKSTSNIPLLKITVPKDTVQKFSQLQPTTPVQEAAAGLLQLSQESFSSSSSKALLKSASETNLPQLLVGTTQSTMSKSFSDVALLRRVETPLTPVSSTALSLNQFRFQTPTPPPGPPTPKSFVNLTQGGAFGLSTMSKSSSDVALPRLVNTPSTPLSQSTHSLYLRQFQTTSPSTPQNLLPLQRSFSAPPAAPSNSQSTSSTSSSAFSIYQNLVGSLGTRLPLPFAETLNTAMGNPHTNPTLTGEKPL